MVLNFEKKLKIIIIDRNIDNYYLTTTIIRIYG